MTSEPESAMAPGGGELGGSGDGRVDAALARLRGLGGTPVAAHVEVFSDVHRALQDVLTSIDQEGRQEPDGREPAPRPGPAPPLGPRPALDPEQGAGPDSGLQAGLGRPGGPAGPWRGEGRRP